MCGRIFQTHNLQRLIQIARTSNIRNSNLHNPNFNTGPTSYIPAVRQRTINPSNHSEKEEQKAEISHQIPKENVVKSNENSFKNVPEDDKKEQILEKSEEREDLELDFLKWGYDVGFTFIINARIEELQDKKMFKKLTNSNRCAVLVEGYYEWNEKKEAFSFKNKDPNINYFFIAGLFFQNDTVVLLTRPATKALEGIHHRMPVLLEEKELDMWLDCKKYRFMEIIDKWVLNEGNEIWGKISFQRVGLNVNNIKNKSEECISSYEDYIKKLDSKGIKQFFKPITHKSDVSEKKINENLEKKVDKHEIIEKGGKKKEFNTEKKPLKELLKPSTIPPKRKLEKTSQKEILFKKSQKVTHKSNIQSDPSVNLALKNFINN